MHHTILLRAQTALSRCANVLCKAAAHGKQASRLFAEVLLACFTKWACTEHCVHTLRLHLWH